MATRKQFLALPRKPLDRAITRLCFFDAKPRVCCAQLLPTKDGVEDDKLGGMAVDNEFGVKLLENILGNVFLIQVPLPSDDGGVDIDLAIPITETAPREPW